MGNHNIIDTVPERFSIHTESRTRLSYRNGIPRLRVYLDYVVRINVEAGSEPRKGAATLSNSLGKAFGQREAIMAFTLIEPPMARYGMFMDRRQNLDIVFDPL